MLALLAQARINNNKETTKEMDSNVKSTSKLSDKQNTRVSQKKVKMFNKYHMPNDLKKGDKLKDLIHSARDGYEAPPTSPCLNNCHTKCNHGDEMCSCKLCSIGSFLKSVQ